MISSQQIPDLLERGAVVVDESGGKVGKIGQVYLDDQSGNPEWVTAKTGLFGTSETFIPIREADVHDGEVRVPFGKDKITDAPRMEDADGHLSPDQEQELYRYYGMSAGGGDQHRGDADHARADHGHADHGHADHDRGDKRRGDKGRGDTGRGDTGRGDHADHDHDRGRTDAGRGAPRGDAEGEMTLSEEQVHVGTEKVAAGQARLRKYVVTENVTKTVPVTREEVRLEREPVTGAERDAGGTGRDLTEDEQVVVLEEERVVVDKETVPVEKVRLGTEKVTEEQQVTEEVRKEQVEADLPEGQQHGRGRN